MSGMDADITVMRTITTRTTTSTVTERHNKSVWGLLGTHLDMCSSAFTSFISWATDSFFIDTIFPVLAST